MVAEPVILVPGLAPAAPIMRVLSRFDREKIEVFAEISIALLDLIDGDADFEAEPDEEEDDPAGQCDEDGINTATGGLGIMSGPGCPDWRRRSGAAMSGPARIAGMVLIEPALPEPVALVTVRTPAPDRERGHFFPTAEEARTFARGVAAQRGLMLVDLIASAEGAEQ